MSDLTQRGCSTFYCINFVMAIETATDSTSMLGWSGIMPGLTMRGIGS